MIRKLILYAALVTAALAATPSVADADVPTLLPHHRFEVLAQRAGSEWQSHGTYRLHVEAEFIAMRLRHQGYQVEIRQFCGDCTFRARDERNAKTKRPAAIFEASPIHLVNRGRSAK